MTTPIALALTGIAMVTYFLLRGILGAKYRLTLGWQLWFLFSWALVVAAIWLEWSK